MCAKRSKNAILGRTNHLVGGEGGDPIYWWGGLIPPQLVTVSTENISPSKKVRNLRLLLFYKLKNFNPFQKYSTPWLNSILSSSMTIALFLLSYLCFKKYFYTKIKGHWILWSKTVLVPKTIWSPNNSKTVSKAEMDMP